MFFEDLTLLLVEPSQTQKHILKDQLDPLGLKHVSSVSSISEAIEYLDSDKADVVLSAMHLPDGKGHELLKTIRSNSNYSSLPFLLVSSETRVSELEPIRQGGTAAIIRKPCTQDDLRRALMDTLDLLASDALSLEEQYIEDIRCLLVDDSKPARMFMSRVLKQLGIEQIVQAVDGEDAANRLAEQFFDLVVTDYNMPNMNGFQLVEHIRTQSSQDQIPVLMVTSDQNGARVAGVERYGVSALVDKPFAIEDVRAILERVFE